MTCISDRIDVYHVAKSSILRHDDYKSYTAEQLVYNVTTRFSQAYKTFVEIYGADALLTLLANVEVKSPFYGALINKYHDMQREHGSVMTHAVFDAYLSV